MKQSPNQKAMSMIGNIFSELLTNVVTEPLIFGGYEDNADGNPYTAVIKFSNSSHGLKIHFTTTSNDHIEIQDATIHSLHDPSRQQIHICNSEDSDPMVFINEKIAPHLK
jgi:hypothetical protein